MRAALLALTSLLFASGVAHADVIDAQANGFQVKEQVEVKAAPDKVWAALITPGRWWNSGHTFSHNAANLTLEPKLGGCFCERLPNGGGAQHLEVIYVEPGKALHLRGAFGPLSTQGVAGAWTILLAPDGTGTKVTWIYIMGGYTTGGLTNLAAPVDAVLTEQLTRLDRYAETGKPQ
ncbi:MAG TPA: SRPBCC domain-containing protein [Caulobacteraceae bacterium]|jgi:uncharacterized protein YndB with AHSA1/START domain